MQRMLIALSAGLLLSLPVPAADSTKASPSQLADSALRGFLRSSDPAILSKALEDARQLVVERAASEPDRLAAATLILRDGLTPAEIALAVPRSQTFDVTRIEIKVPVGNAGRVITSSVGFRSLNFFRGTLEERLAKSVGQQQYRFLLDAENATGVDATDFKEFATTRGVRVFRIDAIATNREFATLLSNSAVSSVFIDTSDYQLREYRQAKPVLDRDMTLRAPVITRTVSPEAARPLDRGRVESPPTR